MKRMLILLIVILLTVPALAESLPDQALGFFEDAGIAADSVILTGNELVVVLTGGGTATLYISGDFDVYNLSWQFTGAQDGDVALYLDHALSLLAALEAKLPADPGELSAAEAIRARSHEALVANSLLLLEQLGDQGLRVLLAQLAAHDDSGLNSLRARLASRMLGDQDTSPVDSAEGCAWYEGLILSVQNMPPAGYTETPGK